MVRIRRRAHADRRHRCAGNGQPDRLEDLSSLGPRGAHLHTVRPPLGCLVVDARSFLGIEPLDIALRWRLEVTEEVSTPGKFLYGGCALAAALVALEHASGRPTAWATAQYLSFAETGTTLDLDVTLAMSGKGVTQGR